MNKGTNEPEDVITSTLVQALILQTRGHGKDRKGPDNIRRGARPRVPQDWGSFHRFILPVLLGTFANELPVNWVSIKDFFVLFFNN